MSLSNFTRVGTDHIIWQKGFSFYRDELEVMSLQLETLASRDSSIELCKQVEHFQNQLIVQRNNIDELNHEVNLYVEKLKQGVPVASEQVALHGKYQDFERVMNLLRHEFSEFVANGQQ
jgi:hypothetical protein